jgi:1,4-alpha-glucan branching enzyme
MSIKKQYLKSNEICKVTFNLRKDVENVEIARITGDFNNWDTSCEPMKKLKSGGFTQTLKFDAGKSYQFKYLINDSEWRNEPEADNFVPNNTGPDEVNSVLEI